MSARVNNPFLTLFCCTDSVHTLTQNRTPTVAQPAEQKTKKANMRVVNVWIPQGEIKRLDELVKSKIYPSRNEAIRFAIRDLLRREGFLARLKP